ncbi:hypothetical protein F66182_3563 [Fusarium sp. NRRL 66182]|nr:hypothetical protein F66182_3563 [Fusarium sp. NRRL 66182]
MPVITTDTPPATTTDTHYIAYIASGEPPWCPDVRNALPALNAVFGGASAPKLYLVRVGLRDEWKDPKNKFRHPPYSLQGVPTVVKVKNGKEVERLGDKASQSQDSLGKLLD